MTRTSERRVIRRATEAGFDAHLIKPVDFDVLQRIIAELERVRPKHTSAV
ncbi:MAG: hypothetical protein ABSG30_14080 [Steroidobacteraceae bacterium]